MRLPPGVAAGHKLQEDKTLAMPTPTPGRPCGPHSRQRGQGAGTRGLLLPAPGFLGPVLESLLSGLRGPLWAPQLPHPQ